MVAAQEISVDYRRTNFLQLLVWKKYFKKTKFVNSIDYVLMYFQLFKLYASTSVCSSHGRCRYEMQLAFCGCYRQ